MKIGKGLDGGLPLSENKIMKTMELNLKLNEQNIRDCLLRYHFKNTDFPLLCALNSALSPLLKTQVWYHRCAKNDQVTYADYLEVVLTLGAGIDALQDVYLERECVSEAYMLDCLALELLTRSYEEFVKRIQQKMGKWAAKIDFLGDTYPLELLPTLWRDVQPEGVTYNSQFMLTPKKSVVFFLPLQESAAPQNPCRVCVGCGNADCIFREEKEASARRKTAMPKPLPGNNTYGYQRIFHSAPPDPRHGTPRPSVPNP